MNTQREEKAIWIALANVSIDRINSSIDSANYAYVTVVGIARQRMDFEEKIKIELDKLGFTLLDLEDVDRYDDRIRGFEVEEAITSLAKELSTNEDIKFSTFHTYD
jgi:hypothetical protein